MRMVIDLDEKYKTLYYEVAKATRPLLSGKNQNYRQKSRNIL